MIKRIIIGILAAGAAVAAGAQEAMTLEQCLEVAMSQNIGVAAAQMAVERAKAMQGSSFDLPATELALAQDATNGGGTDNNISIAQSFDFPTVYVQRRKHLVAQTNLERSNLEVAKNELKKEVIGNYYLLVHAAEVVKIYEHQDSIYKNFAYIAGERLKAGEAGRLEMMNADRLCKENWHELLRARAAYSGIQLVLQGLMNYHTTITPATKLDAIDNNLPAAQLNFAASPMGEVFAGKVAVSERNLSVAKQEYLPSFNFAIKNQLLIKGFNPYNISREKFDKGSFVGFEVGMSVPLVFGSRHAKANAAKGEVQIAKMEQAQAQLAANQQYQQYMVQLSQASQTMAYYNQEAHQNASELARIAQISYENGEISYVEYIQNLQAAAQTHRQHIDAINDYNQIIISLNYLQGFK